MQASHAAMGPFDPAAFPAEDRCLTWSLDQTHWPDPLTPLAFAIVGEALAEGKSRALHAYGRQSTIRVRHIHAYRYQTTVATGKTDEGRFRALVREAMGRLAERWSAEWLPEVQGHLSSWRAFDPDSASDAELARHVEATLARIVRIWEIHFLLLTPMHGAIRDFRTVYNDLLGGTAADALALLRGFDNQTLRMSRALRGLSERARRDDVRAALEGDNPEAVMRALATTPAGRAFIDALNAFLEQFGQRRERLSPEYPSWREDPAPILRTVRMYLAQPADAWPKDAAVERKAAIAGARARLSCFPAPVVNEFEFLLRAGQAATVLSEDHNFWIDTACLYEVRRVLLAAGRRLAEAGAVDAAADAFFLTPDELRAALVSPRDVRLLVRERAAVLDHARTLAPPPTIGGEEANDVAADKASATLRGVGGSGGQARGRARIADGLASSGGFSAGDVLVATSASPVLAPLVGIASALVTETGSILSHCAVIAREYAIPAVLGVPRATTRIRDGQLIEVDGDRGTVCLVPEP